ncbi:hypothetical protein WMY93_028147 [Mugilogobius chulae]|uniref:Exocyst complex component 3-like protein 2 n=1 Tax=Mugilogobius chulae TaxID=88201 RepID=A0AAW0MZM2_9GOBI
MDFLLNMSFEDFQGWMKAAGDYIRPAAVAPRVHPAGGGGGGDAGVHFVAPVALPPVAPAVPVAPMVPVVPPHVAPVAPLVHPGRGGGDAGDYIRPAAVAPLEHPGGGGDVDVYLEHHAYAAALAPVAPAPAFPVVPVPVVPLAPMVPMALWLACPCSDKPALWKQKETDAIGLEPLLVFQAFQSSVTKQQDPIESNTDWLTDHGGSHGKVLDQSETHYGHTEKVPIPISEDMEAVMKRASPESEAHRFSSVSSEEPLHQELCRLWLLGSGSWTLEGPKIKKSASVSVTICEWHIRGRGEPEQVLIQKETSQMQAYRMRLEITEEEIISFSLLPDGASSRVVSLKLKQLKMDFLLNMSFEDFQGWMKAAGDYIRPAAVAPRVHPAGGGGGGDAAPAVPVAPMVPVVPPHVAPVAPLVHPGGGGGDAGDYIRPAAVAPLVHPGGGGDVDVYLEHHAYAAALAPVAPAPAFPVVPVPVVPMAPMVPMARMAPMARMVLWPLWLISRLCGSRRRQMRLFGATLGVQDEHSHVLQLQFEFVSKTLLTAVASTKKQPGNNTGETTTSSFQSSVTKQQDPIESNTDWLTDHGARSSNLQSFKSQSNVSIRASRPMSLETKTPSVLLNQTGQHHSQLFNITTAKSVSTHLKLLEGGTIEMHKNLVKEVMEKCWTNQRHIMDTEKVPIPISEDMEAVMKRASPESEAHRFSFRMALLKNFPVRLRGGGPTLHNALVLRRMSLNITAHMNPFNDDGLDADSQGWSPGSSLLDGEVPRDRNPFEDEEEENEAHEGKRGGVNGKGGVSLGKGGGSGGKGGFKFGSPLKTLGKLGKSLRGSGRGKDVSGSPSESPGEKKKRGRRSSEGSLLRFAGRYRDSLSRKDCISNGDPGSEEDSQSRRLSLMKMVLGKHKRESGSERVSQGPDLEPDLEPEPEVVKPREPLSVLEILQLVKRRDLLLADAHILELEQEVSASCDQSDESGRDDGRRRAKDVELLYEELQKELWAVVRESLRSPTAGPNLGLVVQVLQQEEQVDQDFLSSHTDVWISSSGPRPRRLKQRWTEAVAEMADFALPQQTQYSVGFLDRFLDQIRTRVVEDLSAAKRNVVFIYPPEYQPFKVYSQSYHTAVTKRLNSITESQLQITDTYSLLDWVYNVYNRDVLSPFSCSDVAPLLPSDTLERLELDCLNSVRAKVTSELIQRLQVDLDRSAEVNQSLGSRVAQCSLNGLADFFYSFQRKVELFHEGLQSGMFGDNEDGYVSKTIAQVNCCPPFREFAVRCSGPDPVQTEDSLRRACRALDSVVQCGVRVLSERLYYCVKPLFERLVKKKWLSNTEPFEQIQSVIKENFKKYKRMDSPPYQALVSEVHRRVVTEYLRSLMRGRLICTSAKMRRRTAQRLREEGTAMMELFRGLDSPCRWLEGALSHLSEIIDLEDLPSIQMEVGVLAREYPDVRRKHVSAVLNLRGLTRQSDRVEILNVLKDLDSWDLPRDHALFSEVPVTSELHCVNVGLSRLALTASSCFTRVRPKRNHGKRSRRDTDGEDGL